MAHTKKAIALVVLQLVAFHAYAREHQQPAQRLDTTGGDAKRIADLHQSGRRTDGKLAILWTPAGVLNDAESTRLIERLDRGVGALRKLIGTHPWQAVRDQKIVFYVSDDQFVAHATGTEVVLIPLVRLHDGKAPFLHEAAHALLGRSIGQLGPPLDLPTRDRLGATRPQWLGEGLADYLGQAAAKSAGVTEGDGFDVGGFDGVDRTCADRLSTPVGEEVLPFIGALGGPAALQTTDRAKVAPTFYACAFSFTKFLAEQVGVEEMIALADLQSRVQRTTDPISFSADGVLPRIETLTGKSMVQLRADWLQSIRRRL